MKRTREIVVFILCAMSELGLFYQFYRPIYFIETDIIEKGTISWTIPRAIVIVAMIAMLLFTISLIRGNAKGFLHVSYVVFVLYFVIILIVLFAQRPEFSEVLNSEYFRTNLIVYVVTAIISILTLLLFILREMGGIRLIPNMASLLLLVILGQFVSHGFVTGGGNIYVSKMSLFWGACSVLPYLTIFIFEKFILEPTVKRYR